MCILLSDMGGTNIRFAVMKNGKRLSNIMHFKCADFLSFEDVLEHFLKTQKIKPLHFVLAVPAPVLGDELSFVNNPWHFKISKIKKQFGFETLDVINDFQAQALAILELQKKQIVQIGRGKSDKKFPSVVVGAGTGLGVGVLLPDNNTLASEGGHISISATNETEDEILHQIRTSFGRTSAERIISGSGLSFLYKFFAHKELSSEQILQKALAGDKKALQTVLQMFAFWGDVCGDFALAFGARGGVYLSGGMMQSGDEIIDLLLKSDFRKRFESKGRHTNYMLEIPTFAIVQKDVAFCGLKVLAEKYQKK